MATKGDHANNEPDCLGRLKFLCSHGGKIMPRPTDNQLKYVGGETRVVAVPCEIRFSELMKKLSDDIIKGEMVLKYQLIHEDLDALVSVKSDEDLGHMLEEHDRCERHGVPRLRTFLFPADPVVIENQIEPMERHVLEQRYIDAINGIVPVLVPPMTAPTVLARKTPSNLSHISYGISPVCTSPSSPRSIESCTTETLGHESPLLNGYQNSRLSMHRVRSSPNLSSLGSQHQTSTHNVYQQQQQQQRQFHPNYRQSSRPPMAEPYKSSGPERLIITQSMGQPDWTRYQMDNVP